MLPAAPELSSAAFYIAAGNYRKKTKRDLNWQEMDYTYLIILRFFRGGKGAYEG